MAERVKCGQCNRPTRIKRDVNNGGMILLGIISIIGWILTVNAIGFINMGSAHPMIAGIVIGPILGIIAPIYYCTRQRYCVACGNTSLQ